jgi:hypothetical protein
MKMLEVSRDDLVTDNEESAKWIAKQLGATVKLKLIELHKYQFRPDFTLASCHVTVMRTYRASEHVSTERHTG